MYTSKAIQTLLDNDGLTYTPLHVSYFRAGDSLLNHGVHMPLHPCLGPIPTSRGLELGSPAQAWEGAEMGQDCREPPKVGPNTGFSTER